MSVYLYHSFMGKCRNEHKVKQWNFLFLVSGDVCCREVGEELVTGKMFPVGLKHRIVKNHKWFKAQFKVG